MKANETTHEVCKTFNKISWKNLRVLKKIYKNDSELPT